MSRRTNVRVRCQEVVGEQSHRGKREAIVCGREYTTSLNCWAKAKSKCPACGGRKARCLAEKGGEKL